MRAIARALLETAAFLELSGDDVVDPDSAVKTMESIAFALSKATLEEREVLRSVALELATECKSIAGFQSAAEFYSSFTESFGV